MAGTRPRRIRFAQLDAGAGGYHLSRPLPAGLRASGAPHHHDFAEVFWIEAGRVRHATPAGWRTLRAGHVVFIRPADVHELRPAGDELRLVNLALPEQTLRAVRERYYRGAGNWPWSADAPDPRVIAAGAETVAALSRAAEALALRPASPLATEAFLLALLRDLAPPHGTTAPRDCPDWMAAALERFRRPDHLSGGRAAFVALAGRSPEHVARVARRVFGRPLSAVLREVQLDAAGGLLTMTGREILDIALDCGFGNLGYFYRCFRARFGIPPGRYRRAHRTGPF